MKHKIIYSLLIAVAISSCTKESQTPGSAKSSTKPNAETLPSGVISGIQNQSGQKFVTYPGSISHIQPQPDGTYRAAWGGYEIAFGDMPHRVINVIDGELINDVSIINIAPMQFLSVQTCGPYFMIIYPTFVGSIAPTRQQFVNFTNAYNNFINEARDSNGALIQSSLPQMDSYVTNTGNGEIIVKGKVISLNASPSKMAVVHQSHVSPSQLVD